MKLKEAETIVKAAAENFAREEGELYVIPTGEDEKNYYFDVCSIPPDAHIDWKTDEQIALKYAISPPWFVNKKTGMADISWAAPDCLKET